MKGTSTMVVLVGGLLLLPGCENSQGSPGSLFAALEKGYGGSGICGGVQATTLLAGRHIEAGQVLVWNDEDTLYVRFETSGDWYLSESHLHVADSLEGIPQRRGNPVPGLFAFSATYSPWVTSDTYEIPLTYAEGSIFFIAAHAVVVQGSDGIVTRKETGWGFGPAFSGKNWATYLTYQVQPCEPSDGDLTGLFRTQTQGGWGSQANGNNPGAYRDAHFDLCFSEGVTIGHPDGYQVVFTSSAAIEAFLPQGGASGRPVGGQCRSPGYLCRRAGGPGDGPLAERWL